MAHSKTILAVTGSLAIVSLAASASAQERPRSSTTEVTTERGAATVSRSSARDDSGRSGTVELQGAKGRTATRDFSRRFERGTGVESSSTLTGPAERSRTVDRSAQRLGRGVVERGRQVTSPRGVTRQKRTWVRSRGPH